MSQHLHRLYHGVAIHATVDLEHQAALELLALVMLADHHIAADEIDTVRTISEEWRGGAFSFEQYLGPAMAKARAAINDGTTSELLDDIDARISSQDLRRALLSAAREVAASGDDSAPEGGLLADIAARFG